MLDECDHLGHKFVAISDSSSPGDKAITFNKLLRGTTSVEIVVASVASAEELAGTLMAAGGRQPNSADCPPA